MDSRASKSPVARYRWESGGAGPPHRDQTKLLAREIYTFPPQSEISRGRGAILPPRRVENCATVVDKPQDVPVSTAVSKGYGATD